MRMQLERGRLFQLTEMMDLDARIPKGVGELVHRVEALLRPAEADESDAERFVVDQSRIGLGCPSSETNHGSMLDDAHPRRLGLVYPHEGVGGTPRCEDPMVDACEVCLYRVTEVDQVIERKV